MKFKNVLIVLITIGVVYTIFFSSEDTKIERNEIIKEEKVKIDQSLSKTEQLLKYDHLENINIYNEEKYNIRLSITTIADGEQLPDNFKVPKYQSVDADITTKIGHLNPKDEIELVDYQYREAPKGDYQSWSRCKVKRKDDSDFMAGWLSCQWIWISKERKISKESEDNLWNLCKKKGCSSVYKKENFRWFMNMVDLKTDKNNNIEIDVYKTSNRKEKVSKENGIKPQRNIEVIDYDKKYNMCKIMTDVVKDQRGWVKCNQLHFMFDY